MNFLDCHQEVKTYRCVNIAYSHDLDAAYADSLALITRAHDLLAKAASLLSSLPTSESTKPPTLEISNQSFATAKDTVAALMHRSQAMTELQQISSDAVQTYDKSQAYITPVVQRLTEYPPLGTNFDLGRLVNYPPKLQPIPVKPIFLDVAWNYIDYPGHGTVEVANGTATIAPDATSKPTEQKPVKKGWFGFGR